ncbi:MAG TPA: hypothetical protein VIF57_21730 [Polyangia bacterium]|jgi:hypothetical protein
MPKRLVVAILTSTMAVAAGAVAGCGSGAQHPDDGGLQDADFAQCDMTPAVDYMPGMQATSMSGGYVATVVSARTDFSDGSPSVDTAASGGLDTWVVSFADTTAGTPAAITMMAEKPWMPIHKHGASTFPLVTPGDPGTFTVSKMDLFMLGYWSIVFDLQPTSGVADKVTFAVCIRQ